MFIEALSKIIIFFLPTQLGLHFWPFFSRVNGIKIDYLSPTLYFVDLLLLIYLFVSLKSLVPYIQKHRWIFIYFILFSFLNILFSISPPNTLFWWLRLYLYLLVFISFRLHHLSWSQIRLPLLYSSLVVVSLEFFQLIKQTSIGGPFIFLGERAFSISSPGLARLNLFGAEIIRPPSTFSHPNSLAGYLLIVFYLFLIKDKLFWPKFIPFLGVILSFSKTALVTLLLLIIRLKPEIIIFFSCFFTLIQPIFLLIPVSLSSLSDRLFFYSSFPKSIFRHLLTGFGLGNFIPALGESLSGSFLTPSKLQPIHNLIILYLSELGLVGLFSVICLSINKTYKKIISNPDLLKLLAIVLLTGTFDHYWFTLPQNKLIIVLAFSILL